MPRAEDLLIGQSSAMRALHSDVERVAKVDHSVLILGESGSGKEVVARTIHALSRRNEAPFVGQSCIAIPEGLIESELFGHEPGAFTDARERRIGLFEQANTGSLFLDEIGDVPLSFQKRLLRVLQEREVRRLGAAEAIDVDVRIMSATNAPLESMVAGGQFRSDLFYRLNTFEIRVPSLRQRTDDIPLLVEHFLDRHGRQYGLEPDTPPPATMQRLQEYLWPGNVRELENFVVRWIAIGEDALESLDQSNARIFDASTGDNRRWLTMTMDEIEAEVIQMVLDDCGHNKSLAAKRLGMARKSLYNKIERYGLGGVRKRDA